MAKKTEPAPVVMVTYRCTKGHRWQSADDKAKNSLAIPIGMAGTVQDVCPHCLYEFIKLQLMGLGKVEAIHE